MGRFKPMATTPGIPPAAQVARSEPVFTESVCADPPLVPDPSVITESDQVVQEPDLDALAEREQRLRGAAIDLGGPWSEEARRAALQARLRTSEPGSSKNDVAAFAELARYLREWAVGHGYLDVAQALRGTEIARWAVLQKRSGASPGTVKTRRGRLVESARLYHPDDFRSGRSASSMSRPDRMDPVSDADMELIKHHARMAPDSLAERFEVIFAVVPHTGARAGELRKLRGTDIERIDLGDREIVTVTLTNQQGRTRSVPVLETGPAMRLLELRARYGPLPLVSGDRNALNRCREHLLRRGVTVEFTVERLRSAWLIRLAHQRLPLALALHLAAPGTPGSTSSCGRTCRSTSSMRRSPFSTPVAPRRPSARRSGHDRRLPASDISVR